MDAKYGDKAVRAVVPGLGLSLRLPRRRGSGAGTAIAGRYARFWRSRYWCFCLCEASRVDPRALCPARTAGRSRRSPGRRARAREPPLVRGRRWPPGRPPVHRAPQHVQAEGPAEEGGGALRDVRKRRGDPGGVVRAGPAPDARRRGRRVLWAEAVHGDVRHAPHHVHTEQVRPARERRERHLHAGGVQRGRRREDAVRRARLGGSTRGAPTKTSWLDTTLERTRRTTPGAGGGTFGTISAYGGTGTSASC